MKKGKITIDSEMCKGCYLCINACPQNVITISKQTNTGGVYPATYSTISTKNGKSCIACGSCFQMCPDLAIEVFEIEGEENEY
ncbi:MAG: tungsten formylmethanofuran dehydrogenase [Treponema sp. CETP13]|nr:MAG: tungsten formylmethanofuran dehydrogenase [Treponema sp. CETP13]